MALLDVKDLSVEFDTKDGTVHAVSGVDFSLDKGDTLAIVGESGSGKSQTVFSIMGLLANNGRASGSVTYNGQEILNQPDKQLNRIRAEEIAMIFQDPMTSLNPYVRISDQLAEVLMVHKGMSKKAALAESLAMLEAVKIPDAKNRLNMYPHECSGGMRQRIMIAMALLCRPKLLIADEPTTALDVTVQAQIMTLLDEIQKEFGTAIILITHDLGVVADFCRDTMVMYGGRVMEYAPTVEIFDAPTHPYTRGLLQAIPRLDIETEQLNAIPGNPPNMMSDMTGCPFCPRCGFARERCSVELPELVQASPTVKRACHRPVDELVTEEAPA
ncbi:oligopeptide/dipeptide ABC transporter ATP-binding protein [Oceanomicrobium pacificus]|uniref:Oligopeptide ABC transporter ATP-binding protein OppD n=1 Tax=Oceanomicrobium pacificus TaxID=2692916 RepID=A0A6B0TQP7_9RHOB|nr:oligopeptide/dipeptide ABC transporter ATP-binding protein [Oceanomicrobium pacificus]MXU64088.1 oligopeptide ABC transporter ATP-binding protein OppD [Oceanomicrobium pacificus]